LRIPYGHPTDAPDNEPRHVDGVGLALANRRLGDWGLLVGDGSGLLTPTLYDVSSLEAVSTPEWGDLMSSEGIRGSSDRSVLLLTSLASGPKHGYALIKDIEGFAGVTMGPGTLYGCLGKLEAAGLIEPLPADERRHPYRITAGGAAMLSERLNESARIARVGLKRLSVAM
jgi:DNA-binding PadR family transcriptional regulator